MRANEILTEIFNRPYPVKIFADQAVAKDEQGRPIYIQFDRTPAWETVRVTFDRGRSGEWKLTDWGDEFRTFATVIDAVKKWTDQHQPGALYFGVAAGEPPNRARLYDRMVRRLSATSDYTDVTGHPEWVDHDAIPYFMKILFRNDPARHWWLVKDNLVNSRR